MFRVIKEGHPDWVVAENVAGITSMAFPGEVFSMGGQGSMFEESNEVHELRQEYILNHIIDDLESEGYEVQPFVIPAAAVGAPHRRDRIWIVAHRDSKGLERGSNIGRFSKSREKRDEQPERCYKRTDWSNWPTEPPVCSDNDGISERLDGITFSKWRNESIKTFGNAIVPQVAFEIFQGINEVNKVFNQ